MSDEAIYTAFALRLAAFADSLSPSVPVAWPGIHFDPPDDGPWLELAWFPNETRTYGIPDAGPWQLRGFGQVTVCDRPGSGITSLVSLAEDVIAYYTKGTELGPARVERQPWVSSLLTSDDRIVAPVTVRYAGLVSA